MAALDFPAIVRRWYLRQLVELGQGMPAHRTKAQHAAAILEVLEATRTKLDDWRLAIATEPGWPRRRGRTPEEQCAVRIGHSYDGRRGAGRRVYFLVPKRLD